ncbi:HDOD domain-containing protein [Congregibacter litoralis]|uniref:Putative signal transduction protein n=1 Tax=Congregibacter litoralis KT71 TaxID=314285 RepID=A4AD20_9GAMM|nr:HDOD domain-containing protein [Congregibacter litoralis]EAQ96073.1 putative signal transduction protein [Congregibacter litoralis KT71]
MSNPAFEFVRQLGIELAAGEFDLPPFPDTAMRVQRCVSDPDSDINSLGIIIAGEPALAARLMRMANSAMMRRGPMEVTDINTAISRVGMDMVQNAAVSFAAREAFNFPAGSPFIDDLNKLRQHSVKVASLSYVLGKQSKFAGKPDEAMLAGLLHAVGKFYILTKAADHPELFSDREAIDTLIGQWHTGVARAIVESWNFPESIAIGVDEQELKERDRISSADVSDVLFIANILARAGVKVAGELSDLDALARLRMNSEQLAKVLEENEEEIQSMVEALTG